MPLVGDRGRAGRFAGRVAVIALLAMGSPFGADAQDASDGTEGAESAPSIVETDDQSALVQGDGDRKQTLFADGPREPAALSAEGTLIRGGAIKLESPGQDDAIAALVSDLGAGTETSDSGAADELEETEVEENRAAPPSLLERIGGLLGLESD